MELFDNYYKRFDKNDECIYEKYIHSYHVYGFGKNIMELENFNEQETKLGKLACMFHDIGRFMQWTTYHTYYDPESIDHGEISANIFKEEIAPQLDLTEDEIKLVSDAIYYHNKFTIDNLDGLTKKLTALVRDADKLDIMNSMYLTKITNPMDPVLDLEDKTIPKHMVDEILNGMMVNSKDLKTANSRVIRHLSWINDLNYNSSLIIILNLDLFNRKIDLIKDDSNIADLTTIKNYIDSEINKRLDLDNDFFYKIRRRFTEYVETYDLSDIDIKRKFEHSFRVMYEAINLAKKLKLNERDTKLATLIGLLHDTGRFEQLKVYHTYADYLSVDHASLGCKILFDDGLIKEFWDNEADYDLIRFAIENHNKLQIADTDNEAFLFHAKIIRDADKLDIIYLEGTLKEYEVKVTDDPVSSDIINTFKEGKPIKKSDIKNPNDAIVITYSYILDLYFTESIKTMKEYITEYHHRVNSNHQFDDVYEIINNFLEERIKIC